MKSSQSEARTKKVFLGGLSVDTTEEDVMKELKEYGSISGVTIMTEKETGKPRGFGFALFEDYESVDKLLRTKYIRILVSQSGIVSLEKL